MSNSKKNRYEQNFEFFFFFNLENVSKILISVQATHSQEHVFFFFVVVRVVGQQGIS